MARVAASPAAWHGVRFEEVLDGVSSLGYAGIEANRQATEDFARQVPRLRGLLSDRGLTLVSAPLVGTFFERDERAKEVAALQHLLEFLAETNEGAMVIFRSVRHPARRDMVAGVLPLLPLESDRMARLADTLNEMGDRCRNAGIQAAITNRVGTYIETPDEYLQVVSRTDPELIGLAPDFGHWAYAGGDIDELVRDHRKRFVFPRLKDVNLPVLESVITAREGFFQFVRGGGFCSLGEGTLPLETALLRLERAEYPGWVCVELEPTVADARESARIGRQFLREKLHW